MFKRLRRFILLCAFIGTVVCVLRLLNCTASNPTHRRYSSKTPPLTGNSNNIGAGAERILAKDLGVRHNESQCVCLSNPGPSICTACIVNLSIDGSHRIPDYVGPGYLAESKNVKGLEYRGDDRFQIEAFVLAAQKRHIPLWVYVRVNTVVDQEYFELVESTGGGIVRYFTVPGYEDPVDRASKKWLLVFVPTTIGAGSIEIISKRQATRTISPIWIPPVLPQLSRSEDTPIRIISVRAVHPEKIKKDDPSL